MNDSLDVERLLEGMSGGVRAYLAGLGRERPLVIGIRTGGVWLAQRLHRLLELDEAPGTLNINFYRDDFTRIGMHPRVAPSELPVDVNDRHVVLVDDVLYTGRTIRAALNEIFDYGRPASVTLAVLVERGGRELPIRPDVAGRQLTLAAGESIKLTGPDPLELVVRRASGDGPVRAS